MLQSCTGRGQPIHTGTVDSWSTRTCSSHSDSSCFLSPQRTSLHSLLCFFLNCARSRLPLCGSSEAAVDHGENKVGVASLYVFTRYSEYYCRGW
ncbi:unnamed protein product [Chondrus crispus]|uniref:Uncharacterized protein n=1 Tax=Chondrus crispus TaxID=2769 RepID=R7Q6T4_CHOCR|nr:unnamed protein product [Chondrus crispus]CDF33749.1 unnamed protein product [Chondrus crispus]|eukprot:XP_005713568.1 unnamed protein product [Chondrus crispus]